MTSSNPVNSVRPAAKHDEIRHALESALLAGKYALLISYETDGQQQNMKHGVYWNNASRELRTMQVVHLRNHGNNVRAQSQNPRDQTLGDAAHLVNQLGDLLLAVPDVRLEAMPLLQELGKLLLARTSGIVVANQQPPLPNGAPRR